jgi:glycosyltransferase involved in cell wall biosynthesis
MSTQQPDGLPSITVITPVRNGEETIAAALESVGSQGYPGLRPLVMDGASSDRTVEIARQFNHVEVHSEPDRGQTDALNKGLRRATGDLVGWLNADDIYEPGSLERVGRAFAERPDAPLVTGLCRIIGADGQEIRRPITAYKNFLLRHYSYRLYLTQNFISSPASFMNRRTLATVGEFNERWTLSMDYDMFLRLLRHGEPIVIDEYLSNFLMKPGTLSMENFERSFVEHVDNAREHGGDHPGVVLANRAVSRGIVLTYSLLRLLRRGR